MTAKSLALTQSRYGAGQGHPLLKREALCSAIAAASARMLLPISHELGQLTTEAAGGSGGVGGGRQGQGKMECQLSFAIIAYDFLEKTRPEMMMIYQYFQL